MIWQAKEFRIGYAYRFRWRHSGDIGGFAAATYLRGIPLLHIPTTLLATVDSSIGGKTGINLKEGKNLAGAFYQPQAVICDLSLLDTLPDEVFKDGYAEIIKYGILSGNQLFNRIKKPLKSDIESIVYECVKIRHCTKMNRISVYDNCLGLR